MSTSTQRPGESSRISRRSLLLGLGGLALSPMLTSCSNPGDSLLRLLVLRGSIPLQLTGEFERSLRKTQSLAVNLKVDSQAQLMTLFTQLQTWKQSPPSEAPPSWWDAIRQWIPFAGGSRLAVPDLMTLGDAWLTTAIAQKLIQPFEVSALQGWPTLAKIPQLNQLVTRDAQGQLADNGQCWAVPYRVGTVVIAYRRDIFAQHNLQPPTDWSDLWRADLRRRIALLNNPREVIGLTLKKLQHSYNTKDLSTVPNLVAELQALNQQARYYSSTTYLQPLLLEDVWLAVGWSTDILPLAQRSQQIQVVTPKSGTSLFADLWVRPAMKSGPLPPAAQRWIDFCWQPDYATQLSLATWAVSPALLGTPLNQLPSGFQAQPALLPDAEQLQRSEFLLPLPPSTIQQYREVWTKMRSQTQP